MTATARVLEYDFRVFRRTWRGGLVTTFLAPVLFLASMGFGLGRFVDQSGNAAGALAGVPYAAWLAPGLLAAQAMQTPSTAVKAPVASGRSQVPVSAARSMWINDTDAA